MSETLDKQVKALEIAQSIVNRFEQGGNFWFQTRSSINLRDILLG